MGRWSPNVRTGKRRDDETDDRSRKSALGPHIDVIIHIELFKLISRTGGKQGSHSLFVVFCVILFQLSTPVSSLILPLSSLSISLSFHFFSFVFISWQTPRIFLFWTNSSSSSRDVVSPFIFSCEAAGFSLVCFFLSENSMLRACVGSALFYFRLGFLFPLDWQLFFPSSSFFLLLFLDFFCLCIYIKNWCTAAKTLSLSLSFPASNKIANKRRLHFDAIRLSCCSQPQNTHTHTLALSLLNWIYFSFFLAVIDSSSSSFFIVLHQYLDASF